jgi:hypothetical protein
MEFDPRRVSPDFYKEKLRELKARRDEVRVDLDRIDKEIAWWEQGEALFTPKVTGARAQRMSPNGDAVELMPPSDLFLTLGAKPTLRQAIALVMNASKNHRWKPADMIDALAGQGWLPSAPSGRQMVRNRMAEMAEDGGDLERDDDGFYSLSPAVRNTGLFVLGRSVPGEDDP